MNRIAVLPTQAMSTKPARKVPAMEPMVDSAYRLPAVRPAVSVSASCRRTAKGATMPSSTVAGAYSTRVATMAARCRLPDPCSTGSTQPLDRPMAAVAQAAKSTIRPSTRALGRRSARMPPHQAPRLRLARMMPIRLVQTTSEVPRKGARMREPVNSMIIRAAPQRKTQQWSMADLAFGLTACRRPTTARTAGVVAHRYRRTAPEASKKTGRRGGAEVRSPAAGHAAPCIRAPMPVQLVLPEQAGASPGRFRGQGRRT